MQEKSNLITITKKSFISVVLILLALIIAAGIMTFIIPAGAYLRDASDSIIPGSFSYFTETSGYPVWRWILAPFEVLGSSDGLNIIMISLFLLILGGTFTVMDKTGGIQVIIKKLIIKFKEKKYVLLRLVILVFMMFGSFFGIFEESIALLPIMILLSLSLGWDTMVGIGMCLLAAGFGFASGITNPFSVGIASQIAGVSILSGALFRVFVFILMYLLLSTFLVRYAKKIEKEPTKSPTYDDDLTKSKNFDLNGVLEYKNENTIFKAYITMFMVLLFFVIGSGVLELVAGISIPSIPLMALTFLVGGIVAGYIVTKNIKFTLKTFLNGLLSVAPAMLLIMMAASVKFIITQGSIMDSILYFLANVLADKSAIVGILLIYLLVLIIQFFIGSASAKAFLIMPLLVPLVSLVGISKELAILAFIFGDGYTNVIFPTNGVLLIGLSIASVSYTKWFKWTFVLQSITLALTVVLLIFALLIGY